MSEPGFGRLLVPLLLVFSTLSSAPLGSMEQAAAFDELHPAANAAVPHVRTPSELRRTSPTPAAPFSGPPAGATPAGAPFHPVRPLPLRSGSGAIRRAVPSRVPTVRRLTYRAHAPPRRPQ
jgi:hypothetical protein